MISIEEQIRQGVQLLKGVQNPMLDTQLILAHVLGKDRLHLMMYPQQQLSEQECDQINFLLQKRSTGYPLQYILGHRAFMEWEFIVREGVLIPRPETELLVEGVLKRLGAKKEALIRGLEIGCGSGIISVSLLKYCPALRMQAVDINPAALALTAENAERLEVAQRLNVFLSDLFGAIGEEERYDFIVSNPPYIPTAAIDTLQSEVREYEPSEALDGKEDGLFFYREIVKNAKNHLHQGGFLALEIGYDQGEALQKLLKDQQYREVSVGKDLAGLDRMAYGFR